MGSPATSLARYAAAMVLALAAVPAAQAQNIEPRAYSNDPVGVNFVIVGGLMTQGDLSFDASLPITSAEIESTRLVAAYARALDLGGKSGKFDVIVQYVGLFGSAEYRGAPVERAHGALPGDLSARPS